MRSVSIEEFHKDLDTFAELVAEEREIIRVTQVDGKDVVVMSLDEWEGRQDTFRLLSKIDSKDAIDVEVSEE